MDSNAASESQEESKSEDHIKSFSAILSCFRPGHDPPILLFQRSANSQLRWGRSGELQTDRADVSLVPACIVELFEDKKVGSIDNRSPNLQKMIDDRLIIIKRKQGQEYLSLPRRDEILALISDEDRICRSFEIISIVALAFPEEYSSIVWEEVREQLREVVETECLPILRVIDLGDLLNYLTFQEIFDGSETRYFEIFSRFLISIAPSYPYLRFFAVGILDYMDTHSLDQMRVQTLELQMFCCNDLQQERDTLEKLKAIVVKPRDKKENATAGILIGCMLQANPKLKSGINLGNLWEPFEPNHASPLEEIANAVYNAAPESDEIDVELELKAIIGLIYSKRRFFRHAKETLRGTLGQIEVKFGPCSWELAIIVAELVKCCNMTQDQDEGERLARDTLTKRQIGNPRPLALLQFDHSASGLKVPATDHRADSSYLLVSLADSLMAGSRYDEAIAIFQGLLDTELPPSLVVKISLRSSKAERRMGEIFPSPKITHSLSKGISRLPEVSARLQNVFAEELLCNIQSREYEDFQIDQSVQEMKSTLASALRLQRNQGGDIGQFVDKLSNNLQQIMATIEQKDSGKWSLHSSSGNTFSDNPAFHRAERRYNENQTRR
jgi:hypothetical protein